VVRPGEGGRSVEVVFAAVVVKHFAVKRGPIELWEQKSNVSKTSDAKITQKKKSRQRCRHTPGALACCVTTVVGGTGGGLLTRLASFTFVPVELATRRSLPFV
jgi:hypothetical protein